jgi:hypothetical protein
MASGIVAAACVLTSSALLRTGGYSRQVMILIALMPVPAYALLIWSIARSVVAMDEMQRRVQLHAYATSLVGTLVVTIAYGFMQKLGWPSMNWGYVSVVVFLFYMIGYFAAARRYQ